VTEGEWFVKSENMRPQGYKLQGFLNPAGGVNYTGGNTNITNGGTFTAMSVTVPSRGQVVWLDASVMLGVVQSAPGKFTTFGYLTIDGTIVAQSNWGVGSIGNNVGNPFFRNTNKMSWAGYLSPGIHTVRVQLSAATNGGIYPTLNDVPSFGQDDPELTVLML
jgi:hypothetical protein